jgi:hypothetical protein
MKTGFEQFKKFRKPCDKLTYHMEEAYFRMFIPTVCFNCNEVKQHIVQMDKILKEKLAI